MENTKKQRAMQSISNIDLLARLSPFKGTVVSSIFVDLDLDHSDIDVICCFSDPAPFQSHLSQEFGHYEAFKVKCGENVVLCNFWAGGFEFEIYGTTVDIPDQPAYRHYKIMERLLKIGGQNFTQSIKQLKAGGLKTEPAICHYLKIAGDPYQAILDLENWTDERIEAQISSV